MSTLPENEQVNAISAGEIISNRRWPAWFTVEQMRQQLRHEAAQLPQPERLVECPACGGDGDPDGEFRRACGYCDGSGKVTADEAAVYRIPRPEELL